MTGRSASRTLHTALKTGLFLIGLSLSVSGCQFQPLYSSDSGTVGTQSTVLSRISVAEVNTRTGQQVRNHLIFLLNGGASPLNPTHEVRLRINVSPTVSANAIGGSQTGIQKGNTAGRVTVDASYEIYDLTQMAIVHRGSRTASAAYDQNNQSFAAQRAERDAENRAARELAEQLRLAISADFNKI